MNLLEGYIVTVQNDRHGITQEMIDSYVSMLRKYPDGITPIGIWMQDPILRERNETIRYDGSTAPATAGAWRTGSIKHGARISPDDGTDEGRWDVWFYHNGTEFGISVNKRKHAVKLAVDILTRLERGEVSEAEIAQLRQIWRMNHTA